MKTTIIGMIYKSIPYLDFMMYGITKYGITADVNYLIVANDASEPVLSYLQQNNIKHITYHDPVPTDYYLNRVYRAWNFGGRSANSDVVVFVNSDQAYSPGWLSNLLKCLNKETIPCSRLVETGKMPSGQHALKGEFGRSPNEFAEKDWLKFVAANSSNFTAPGGLYMPVAFYKDDFILSGGYPEGNIYMNGIGKHTSPFKMSGDDYFFHTNTIMSKKQHITVFNSIVYHIIEGEKDA